MMKDPRHKKLFHSRYKLYVDLLCLSVNTNICPHIESHYMHNIIIMLHHKYINLFVVVDQACTLRILNNWHHSGSCNHNIKKMKRNAQGSKSVGASTRKLNG